MFMVRFLFCILIIALLGCSNLEFVYNYQDNIKFFHKKTLVSVSGDDSDVISGYLSSKLKTANDEKSTYGLTVKSDKDIDASIIEKDATASKFKIKYNISYKLKNNLENCLLINKKITTESYYDAKSSGYSFGTDVSEKESSVNNLQSNVDEFLNILAISELDKDCL